MKRNQRLSAARLLAAVYFLFPAVSGCSNLLFNKLSYGTGKQKVTTVNMDPIKSMVTEARSMLYIPEVSVYEFNMTDPLLADCAGFWFLSGVTNSLAQTLHGMGGTGTGYWCSGSQAIRRHFDGNSVTTDYNWQPTVRLRCKEGPSRWIAETGMLHGSNIEIDRIECNTMAQQYGPCTRTG